MAIVTAQGQARATPHAKRIIAMSMYAKGKAFIGAAILLQGQPQAKSLEHIDYVVLNLLCQGIEVTLKGLLLLNDFDKYYSQLKRLGHNLPQIARATTSAYRLNPMRDVIALELATLAKSYSQHTLRYGGIGDLFIDPRSIPRDAVFRRTGAIIKLAEKNLGKGGLMGGSQ